MGKQGTPFTVIVVTGLSGSGKSTALRVFEDLGFFCVDGLPLGLVPKLAGLFAEQDAVQRGLVLGLDLRQRDFLEEWNRALVDLTGQGAKVSVIFLEAKTEALMRRYASTRRLHPLENRNLGLEQALRTEREMLDPLRKAADLVLDTTDYSIHDLRRTIQDRWSVMEQAGHGLRVHVLSFGFKYGPPSEADLVFDLRFLPNPYFVAELCAKSGKDKAVADYALQNPVGKSFTRRFMKFLLYLLPLYAGEGRYRVTLALGCTGGRHRSVALAERVYRALKRNGYAVTLEHRHCELG